MGGRRDYQLQEDSGLEELRLQPWGAEDKARVFQPFRGSSGQVAECVGRMRDIRPVGRTLIGLREAVPEPLADEAKVEGRVVSLLLVGGPASPVSQHYIKAQPPPRYSHSCLGLGIRSCSGNSIYLPSSILISASLTNQISPHSDYSLYPFFFC